MSLRGRYSFFPHSHRYSLRILLLFKVLYGAPISFAYQKLIVDVDALSKTSSNIMEATSTAQLHQNTSTDQVNEAVMLVERINLLVENLTIMIDSEGKI